MKNYEIPETLANALLKFLGENKHKWTDVNPLIMGLKNLKQISQLEKVKNL